MDLKNLQIVQYPHKALRVVAARIENIDDDIRSLGYKMVQIMNSRNGLGLAANQVAKPVRLFVCRVPKPAFQSARGPHPEVCDYSAVYINPVIDWVSDDIHTADEGCLSLDGVRGYVNRPYSVQMTAESHTGEIITKLASGLLARVWQHEIDHLNGINIVDTMTKKSKRKNRLAIRRFDQQIKEEKANAEE